MTPLFLLPFISGLKSELLTHSLFRRVVNQYVDEGIMSDDIGVMDTSKLLTIFKNAAAGTKWDYDKIEEKYY